MEYQAAETAHRAQGAVQNYSVFKDSKRPLVEYDVGIKITGHWSFQNIRVSSKKQFQKYLSGAVYVPGTVLSAAFTK